LKAVTKLVGTADLHWLC